MSYDFGEKSHILHTAKVPFVLQEKRASYANPKWITIDKLFDSGLQYVSHEQVDVFLAKYGTIIVPTKYKTDVHGFRTGKRDARIDLKVDIDRWQSVGMKVQVEGKEVEVTGKVNFFYKGQPYNCRDCREVHSEKCPQKVTRDIAEAEGEKARKKDTRTLMMGDSNMRRINEKAFYVKTDCATGAKIGHVANSLEWTTAGGHENITIHCLHRPKGRYHCMGEANERRGNKTRETGKKNKKHTASWRPSGTMVQKNRQNQTDA